MGAFVALMCYFTGYAYKNGNVSKLTAPLDAANNFCGVDEYYDYPYLYLTDFDDTNIYAIFTSGICVSECPATLGEIDCMPNDVIDSCEVAPEKFYESTAYIEYCLPTDWDAAPDSFLEAFEMER